MNEFVVYALYSELHDKIYIGYTHNLINRIKSHNHLGLKGYTLKFRPWIVVHVEFYDNQRTAMTREKSLKSSRGRDAVRKSISELSNIGLRSEVRSSSVR